MSTFFPALSGQLPTWLIAIVEASLLATLLAGLVVGIQLMTGARLPARWRFALWFLVLARLVPVPMPESRWSVFNALNQPEAQASPTIERHAFSPAGRPSADAAGPGQAAPAAFLPLPVSDSVPAMVAPNDRPHEARELPQADPVVMLPAAKTPASNIPAATSPTERVTPQRFPWGTLVIAAYLMGAALLGLRYLAATLRLSRLIRSARPATDQHQLLALDSARRTFGIRGKLPLLLVDALGSPALVGFFRPRLLLPEPLAAQLSAQDLRHVFLHECAHLRRRDVLLNYLLALLTLVHWFNPLLHLLLPRIRADRELATDELVLLHTEAVPYGQTLLNVFQAGAIPSRAPASVAITETRTFFARRIAMIARFQKKPAWINVPAALALAIISACTLTAPISRAVDRPAAAGSGGKVEGPESSAKPAAPEAQRTLAKTGGIFEGVYQTTSQAAADNANAQAREKLEQPVKDFRAAQIALDDVLQYLQEQSHLSFAVNWRALESAGVDRKTQVTTQPMKDIPLRRALITVLVNGGGGGTAIDYTVEDGVVLISTKEELRSPTHVSSRVYNIRPLLNSSASMDEQIDHLIDIIKTNVEPETWRDNGGTVGSISEYNGLLTITTSSDLHHDVAEFLGTLFKADQGAPLPPSAFSRSAGKSAPAGSAGQMIAKPVTLAGTAIEQASAVMQALMQQVGDLAQTRMHLEQERAALETQNNSSDQIKALDARMKVVNDQLEQLKTKLSESQAEFAARSVRVRVPQKLDDNKAEDQRHATFDVRSLLGATEDRLLTPDERSAMSDLVKSLSDYIGPNDKISAFNGTIIVDAPDSTINKLRGLVDELREQDAKRRANSAKSPK